MAVCGWWDRRSKTVRHRGLKCWRYVFCGHWLIELEILTWRSFLCESEVEVDFSSSLGLLRLLRRSRSRSRDSPRLLDSPRLRLCSRPPFECRLDELKCDLQIVNYNGSADRYHFNSPVTMSGTSRCRATSIAIVITTSTLARKMLIDGLNKQTIHLRWRSLLRPRLLLRPPSRDLLPSRFSLRPLSVLCL